jgi:hypothetical protein
MATTFAVPDGRVAMAATLWAGNNSTKSISNAVNGISFQPGLVWLKDRTQSQYHTLYDSTRYIGPTRSLILPLTDAEGGQSNLYGYLSSFDSDGFTLTPGSTSSAWVNASGDSYVSWQWKSAGIGGSNNTAGAITSSVSANTTAKFSIVLYTGTGANATVGHGLDATPGMIIIKSRTGAYNWIVYHSGLTSAAYYVSLNQTIAQTSYPTAFNSTAPTSTVFSIGTDASINQSTYNYVAYCWAPVAGYSAFGTYTGNGVVDGPFIYTGFRPRFIMFKRTDTTGNWLIEDTSRDTSNPAKLDLIANDSTSEINDTSVFDILSNGFKGRNTYAGANAAAGTYIYAAFAENPLKYSNAR